MARTQERQREPDEHLLCHQHGVGGRDGNDGRGDERAEKNAERCRDEGRTAEGRDALGEPGVMEDSLGRGLFAVEARFQDFVLAGLRLGRLYIRLLARLRHRIADDMRDPLLGGAVRDRKFLVVPDAALVVAQYAAGMIDEAKRFFDVALTVPRLRIIFADQPAKRGPDLLVRGGLRYAQRFVQRRSHRIDRPPDGAVRYQESSGKSPR